MDTLSFEKLKENKRHGETMFPVAVYPVSYKAAGRILPPHWHSEMELIYLAVGEAVFTIDNEDILVKSGECIFVNCGQIHSAFSNTEVSTYFSVVFNTEFLSNTFDVCNKFFDGIKSNKYKIIQHFKAEDPSQYKIIFKLKEIIDELTVRSIAYELNVKSNLLSIFSIIFKNALYAEVSNNQKNFIEDKKRDSLKQIMVYIYQNYSKKIKLTHISESINLTPQYLCKLFKDMTDMSIVDYINQYRIETASTLLKISKLNITDIALECGFDNVSYFNRVFKKQLGCTPTEFRLKFLSH